MKNLFPFWAATLFFVTIGHTQIVNIPDPNFKNALLLQNPGIDANDDGEIQVSEAIATTDVNVNGSFITDLTGIEAFINITFLDCSFNNLTSIDVSNNTSLEIFECYNNQLTNIDTSNNTELHQFECRFNQLTALDVSNNSSLVLLSLGNNNITQIDVSNNPFLFILECRETFLENLDLSNNSFFESLICNDNTVLKTINLKNGNNDNITFGGPFPSNFENLPNLESICIDDVNNTVLIDTILNQVGHAVTFAEDCALGVGALEQLEITLFPNPVKNILNIKTEFSIVKTSVYTMQGRLLKQQHQNTPIKSINLEILPTGMYFIKITAINGKEKVIKIIKTQ